MNSKKKVVRDYFDQEVMTWEMVYTQNSNFLSHNMVERQKRVLEMLDQRLNGNATVLDAGCGAGMTILQLLQRGHIVYGVDISREMIRKAKQGVLQAGYNGKSYNFSTGDVEDLPFANEYFDAVICMGVFSYLEDDIKAIQEIYRVECSPVFLILWISLKRLRRKLLAKLILLMSLIP
jgi:ubiquinone/menaquinone biosynthesis C-methylase UbiE